MTTAAILLAGGAGSRAKLAINKVYAVVGGRPLLAYPLETLDRCRSVDRIVVVARPEDRERVADLVATIETPVIVTDGGRTRQESELHGLEAIAGPIGAGQLDLVAIHDGARPFLSSTLLEAVVEAAGRTGGAIPGYLPAEPLFRAAGGYAEPIEDLRMVQTPQCFRARPLLDAYRSAARAGFAGADTAETVERFSDLVIAVVPGDPNNFKVTFDSDLQVAADIASRWQDEGGREAERPRGPSSVQDKKGRNR